MLTYGIPPEFRGGVHCNPPIDRKLFGSLLTTLVDWIGLDWTGLDWIGLDWIGLDWIGLEAHRTVFSVVRNSDSEILAEPHTVEAVARTQRHNKIHNNGHNNIDNIRHI